MNIHSLKMKRTVILHSEKTLEPFARSQKQIPTPAVFTTRTVRFESLQRYRFVQVDRCPSALSIAQWPFNLRTVEKVKWTLTESSGCTKLLACRTFKEKKLQKHKKAPVSTEIPLYKSSFSVFFLFLCYILGTKKRAKHPKKQHRHQASLLRRCSAWHFPKLQFGVHFPRIFSAISLSRKKGHQPETFHWSTGCLNDGILIMVYNLL